MNVCGWSSGGMTPTNENRSNTRKTYPNATLSTTNPTRTDREVTPIVCGERSVTNYLKYDRNNDTVVAHVRDIPRR